MLMNQDDEIIRTCESNSLVADVKLIESFINMGFTLCNGLDILYDALSQ